MSQGERDAVLKAQLSLLAEENRRLRREYRRIRQARYRQTAVGLAALGALSIIAALIFVDVRDVLIAIGAIGLFGGLLVYYLTPESVVPASVGELTYATMADSIASIADNLGLRDIAIYTADTDTISLFIPQPSASSIPDANDGPIVTDAEHRGLIITATGDALLGELSASISGILSDIPVILADQLAEGAVETLELAMQIDPEADDDRITFAISGSAIGGLHRVDHPLVSTLAAGIARGLDQPVGVEVHEHDDARYDWLVTCWIGVDVAKPFPPNID